MTSPRPPATTYSSPRKGFDGRAGEVLAPGDATAGAAPAGPRTTLDGLRAHGLRFADATVETLRICQDRFIAESPRVQAFMEKYRIKVRP